MKLLYIYDHIPKVYQAYMLTLLEELKKEISVKVLTYDDDKRAAHNIISYGVKDKLQRLASKTKLSKDPSLDIKIMKEYDVIHLQHSYLYPKLQPFFNDTTRKLKIIITLRGGDTYIKPWVSERWKIFYKENSKYIDAFVTVSQHQKEYLQKWGVSENKIHVIPISFGVKSIAMPKYPNKGIVKIISAFRMCWEKNIEGNLRTVKVLKEKGVNVQYDIYGDGPDKGQVYYLIDKYGLEKEVNCFGKIENTIFKKRLKRYDFYLQLSHSESFGGSVIEAQSEGVPCIVSNSDGLPEAIFHKETGYCVNTNDINLAVDYIIKLWSDSELYYSFSKEAIKYVNNNFTVKHEVDKLMKLYKEIV